MAANTWTKPINQILGAASSYYHGYPQKPSHSSYQNIPDTSYHQNTPLQVTSYGDQCSKPPSANLRLRRKSYHRLKRYLKIVTAFSLAISSLLTLFMELSMIYVLYKWLRTRHTAASDYSRSSPWANHTVIWPTCMLLASSAVTFFLCFAMLITACCRSKKKSTFSMLYNLTHVVLWAVVMVLYRVNKTEKDLWGWSCSKKAEGIQGVFEGVVDFNSLCKLQVGSRRYSEADVKMWKLTA